MEARIGNSNVGSEPDGAQFTVNTVCGTDQTGVADGPRHLRYECGEAINGKYVALQALGPSGVHLCVSEVTLLAKNLMPGETCRK